MILNAKNVTILSVQLWADYWKSNDRKFCDFCKCWIADNKPSISFHENGRRHKANVAKRISEISKKSVKDEKIRQNMNMEIRKMEDAAMKAYAKDISRNADITSQNINNSLLEKNYDPSTMMGPNVDPMPSSSTTVAYNVPSRPVDPMLPPIDIHELAFINAQKMKNQQNIKNADGSISSASEPSLWCEALSPEGHTYYWNVKTNESVWEAPKEGYMTIAEYNKINRIAIEKQEQETNKEFQLYQKNADEIAAKLKREKLKDLRIGDNKNNIKKEWEENTDFDADGPIYTSSGSHGAPYGQWQTVTPKIEKKIDLQLPKVNYQPYIPVTINSEPEILPVKQFKEKVTTLDKETVKSEIGVFKKRKLIGINKKNARQRLDVD